MTKNTATKYTVAPAAALTKRIIRTGKTERKEKTGTIFLLWKKKNGLPRHGTLAALKVHWTFIHPCSRTMTQSRNVKRKTRGGQRPPLQCWTVLSVEEAFGFHRSYCCAGETWRRVRRRYNNDLLRQPSAATNANALSRHFVCTGRKFTTAASP